MSFDSIETSPLGRPVDLYEFSQNGIFTRVTSAATSQFIGGAEFTTLAISRTEPKSDTEDSGGELTVRVPSIFSIATQFRGVIPSSLPSLTIFQKHLNDPADLAVAIWKGTIVSCAFGDGDAEFLCQPITRLFANQLPRRTYSASCSHQLYDNRCNVVRSDYSFVTTIGIIDSTGFQITFPGLRARAAAIDAAQTLGLTSSELDNFWNRGFIGSTDTPSEFRNIVNANVGGDPDVVEVSTPFRTAVAGTNVEVSAGCNHDISTDCLNKFKNAVNFGGTPHVPGTNPFSAELDRGINIGPVFDLAALLSGRDPFNR